MRGISRLSLERLEQRFLNGALRRRYRIVLFVLIAFFLYSFSLLPYFNLYFNAGLAIAVSIILAPFILDLDERLFFVLALGLFVIVLPIWFLDWQRAELITNYIFAILFSGILKALSNL